MRRVAVASACSLLLVGCSSSPTSPSPTVANVDKPGLTYYPPAERAPAPALSGPTLSGSRLSLADVVGSGVVVVNVWASWCTECRAESRGLADLSAEFGTSGSVRFVGIDEQDVPSKAKTFAAAEHMSYPQLVDADGTLLRKLTMLPSDGIPSTLVLDRTGHVAGRIIGAADETRLRQLVARVASDY